MYNQIIDSLKVYKNTFPKEKDVDLYFKFLANTENLNEQSTNRKNSNGHITVSGFVVHEGKTLLLWHKAIQKFFQPGGHIDLPDKNLFEAVIREVKEETGLEVVEVKGIFSQIPIMLDIHKIPENKNKNELEHLHFDLMFWLELKSLNQEILNCDDGVEGVKWVSIDEIKQEINPYIYKTLQKYKKINSVIIS